MAEYIEREAAIGIIEQKQKELMPAGLNRREYLYGSDREAYDALQEISNSLEAVPAAAVAPVVHSRFVDMGGFPACEHCGASPAVWEPKPNNQSGYPPYCYNCGALMDKEATDEQPNE